jgi:hypothetical protein
VMATATQSPAHAWVAELNAARAALVPYERASVEAFLAVLDRRPRYTGPMRGDGAAYIGEQEGRPVVRLRGEVTPEQAPLLLAWIERVLGLED